ncbi:divergent polysaccharide deacetylase family protein [Roseovarius sp. EL26]|uniref:divergent polysaccharide deacetylase family protein n=1 Tax=Roseovarius sp. EL26 TaxID=2126672 RepID=UPI0020B14CE1|nr:divergent polysaccharide deacetylase family protein [Roseovarius sp. EL26]
MRQGIFAGLITGTMVSGLALGTVSLVSGTPNGHVVNTPLVDVPDQSGFAQTGQSSVATALQDQTQGQAQTEESQNVLSGETSTPDTLDDLSNSITQPAAQPDIDAPETALTVPEGQDTPIPVTVTTDAPVLTVPQTKAIAAPGQEQALSVSTVPAQPLQPAAPVEDTAGHEDQALDVQAAYDADQNVPESSGTISDIADGVTTDRLPSITQPDSDGGTLGAAPETEETAFGDVPDTTDLSPLERYSNEFDNPDNKPLMAIVLMVDHASALDSQVLEDFPYPVSFAIDVQNPDAAQLAQQLRAAGHEVLAQIDLPSEVDARGTEEAMQIYLNVVPEAVAVIEGQNGGMQANRSASKQLAPILRDSGHGVVLMSNGLNTAQKLIAREGVPSASVFRDFDAQGQNERMIRRFLDQGAFRAGQEEEGVIMLGRLQPETAKALVVWALEDRAGQVALAPVSAVLSAEQSKVAFGQ